MKAIRTEDRIRMLLEGMNATDEVKQSMQTYIYDLLEKAYNMGYNDGKNGNGKNLLYKN